LYCHVLMNRLLDKIPNDDTKEVKILKIEDDYVEIQQKILSEEQVIPIFVNLPSLKDPLTSLMAEVL